MHPQNKIRKFSENLLLDISTLLAKNLCYININNPDEINAKFIFLEFNRNIIVIS